MPATHPRIPIPPPYMIFAFALAGAGLYSVWPFGWGLSVSGLCIGLGAIVFGWSLMQQAIAEFSRAQTGVSVYKPATTIVTTGPYAWSRNPIYVGWSLCFVGWGLIWGNGWVLGLYVLLFLVLNTWVIDREEAYLAETFGEDYMDYQKLVRRWV